MIQFPVLSDILARGGHSAELLRGSSQAMALRLVGMALNYAFNFLVARFFGASAVGAFALATTVVTIIGMLSRLGFDRAIVRFVASNISAGRRQIADQQYWLAFCMLSLLGICLSLVLLAGADVLAGDVFDKPELASAFRLASPAVLFLSISLFNAEALRGLKKIFHFASMRYIAIYLFAIPLLFLPVTRLSAEGMPIFAYSAACACAAVLSLALTWRKFSGFHINFRVGLPAMLSISIPMLLSNSMGMIVTWTDVLMLGRFVSEDQIGVYSIAMKLAFLTSITLNATNSISMPKFAELHATGRRHELGTVMRRTTKLLFFSTIPILGILILAGRPILGSFGTEFEQGYVVLVVLVVGQVVSTISGPVGNLLQMSGYERPFLIILSIFALVNIVLNLALIPRLGILGAALASGITLSVKNVVCVIFIYRQLGFVSIYLPWVTKDNAP